MSQVVDRRLLALGERLNRRLAVLQAAAAGARAAAGAAAEVAATAEQRYREALSTVLDAHGVAITPRTGYEYAPDDGTVAVAELDAAGRPDAATTNGATPQEVA